MTTQIYKNVVQALIDNGIDPEFASLFVNKGIKDLGETPDTIGEKKMGMALQRHVFNAIQMFMDENKAQKVIHNVTLKI
jgi:hypothetical protein